MFGSTVGYYKLSVIERVTRGFDPSLVIGSGGFGKVFSARIGIIDVVRHFSYFLLYQLLYQIDL